MVRGCGEVLIGGEAKGDWKRELSYVGCCKVCVSWPYYYGREEGLVFKRKRGKPNCRVNFFFITWVRSTEL